MTNCIEIFMSSPVNGPQYPNNQNGLSVSMNFVYKYMNPNCISVNCEFGLQIQLPKLHKKIRFLFTNTITKIA